jgi:hypothetical protein
LVILDEVCKSIGVISPVGFYEVPIQPSNENDGVDNDDPSMRKDFPQIVAITAENM